MFKMIGIYRNQYDSELNLFHGKNHVERNEVKIITKSYGGIPYTCAEPTKEGRWTFGGTILFTSNGIYPEFNTPIKLHDRNMDLERK
jgi:hypothetical protein